MASLELKLPFISEVNDPSDCSPIFFFGNDTTKAKAMWLRAFKSRNILVFPYTKNILLTEDGKKLIIDGQRKLQENWNRSQGCLLSVSANERNAVMWAHYSEVHKGAVVGLDFDAIRADKGGIKMDPVIYSEHRPKLDVLQHDDIKKLNEALMTKSLNWAYEKEFRTVFVVDAGQRGAMDLINLKQRGLASFKDFNNKETWFLRVNPLSIKKVIFGLYTDEDLKLSIRKLIAGSQLQDVKLYQATESETYEFDLIEL